MSQIITNLTSLPIMRSGVSGRFRGILRDLMGKPVYDTGWFDNTILDSGLPILGEYNWWWGFYIGSNGTASDVSMTGLQAYEAQTVNAGWNGPSAAGSTPNWERSHINSGRFPLNTGPVTIREFGIGQSGDDTGNDCVARQVVTPEITMTADNVLDLFYEFTHWPALGDSLANGVLIGTETYNTITRSMQLDTATCYVMRPYGEIDGGYYYLYEGDIGTILEAPTPPSDSANSGATYGPITQSGAEWYRDTTVFTDINNGNFTTGVQASAVRHFNQIYYQTSFKADGNGTLPVDSPIPKNDTNEIDLTYRTYWGRYTP